MKVFSNLKNIFKKGSYELLKTTAAGVPNLN